jgi:hypothetical protein
MSINEAGVDQAWKAFFKNDPFDTRPGSEEEADQPLWAVFRERFLQTSCEMLKTESEDRSFLAERLISKIEEQKA